MISSRGGFGRYLLYVAGLAGPFFFLMLLNALLLWRADEFTKAFDIARSLQQGGAIYESGLHDLRQVLKLEIIRQRKPQVIALGSSRPLDFRQEMFTAPFACACQALTTLEQAKPFLQRLQEIHAPKVVLFLIDFWWFFDKPSAVPRLVIEDEPQMTTGKFVEPWRRLWRGDLTPKELFGIMITGASFAPVTENRELGLLARTRGIGIRADGSMLMGLRFTDDAYRYYEQFREAFADPEKWLAANERYRPNHTVQPERVRFFGELVDQLKSMGSHVILILPPIAPPIYQAMASRTGYDFLTELPRMLAPLGNEFYDFHDPASIGAGACEFADIHHGGNTAYARLLTQIVNTQPRSGVARIVDIAELRRLIDANVGRTIMRMPSDRLTSRERDFLRLGCEK